MERLGFNRDDAPNIAWGVQPTISLGDASSLTSPILPPLAWFGSTVFASAGENFTFAVRSVAPGGSFLRELRVSSNANGDFSWEFTTAPTVINAEQVLTAQNMTPDPVTAVVRAGSQTGSVLGTTNLPQSRVNASVSVILNDLIYLPPGIEMTIQFAGSNTTCRGACLVQDAPAIIPSAGPNG